MSDLNTFNCTGRLGANAESRSTAGGTAVWSARIAVGYGYGENKGTNWLTVLVFGKRAEGLGKLNLEKGAQIAVSGELRVREYDKKDGSKGTSVEVNANEIHLIGSKPDGARPERANANQGPVAAQAADDSDDIPW